MPGGTDNDHHNDGRSNHNDGRSNHNDGRSNHNDGRSNDNDDDPGSLPGAYGNDNDVGCFSGPSAHDS